ncbi:MAG: lysoplasmalogenase [Firmicutes bacterium]|nr:lysoplasmalogenase [Bacillota bacterium]
MLKLFVPRSGKWLWALAGSFLISIAGDWFLRSPSSETDSIFGIAGYFIAHAGFLAYGWVVITGRRKFSWVVFGVILVPFLSFYFVSLRLSQLMQNNVLLAIAALIYLLISCLSLAASIDVKSGWRPSWTWGYALGIACLLASDTLIALNSFLRLRGYGHYILPLFYTSYVLIAGSVIFQNLFLKGHGHEPRSK